MNSLFLLTHSLWAYHAAETLEVALRRNAKGDDVTILYCDGVLNYCNPNPNNNKILCMMCRHRTQKFKDLFPQFHWLKLKTNSPEVTDDKFQDHFDSTIATVRRSTDTRVLKNSKKKYLPKLARDAGTIYAEVNELIEKHNIQVVYAWNGRRTCDGPALLAAKDSNKRFFSIVTGKAIGSLCVTPTLKFHDIDYQKTRIKRLSKHYSNEHKEKHAQKYQAFAKGDGLKDSVGFSNYAADFNENDEIHESNVVIFMGTFYEFYGQSDWADPIFNSFNDALIHCVKILAKQNVSIIIRWHPNSRNLSGSELRGISKVNDIIQRFDKVKIFNPKSNVNSYSLIKNTDTVISIGSSIVIEAALMEARCCIFIGRNYFEDLDCFARPKSIDELNKLLSMRPSVKSTKSATDYAAYVEKFETTNMKYICARNKNDLQYLGQPLAIKSFNDKVLHQVQRLFWLVYKIKVRLFY